MAKPYKRGSQVTKRRRSKLKKVLRLNLRAFCLFSIPFHPHPTSIQCAFAIIHGDGLRAERTTQSTVAQVQRCPRRDAFYYNPPKVISEANPCSNYTSASCDATTPTRTIFFVAVESSSFDTVIGVNLNLEWVDGFGWISRCRSFVFVECVCETRTFSRAVFSGKKSCRKFLLFFFQ